LLKRVRNVAAVALLAGSLTLAPAATASAQVTQNGLVNVSIDNTNLIVAPDVNVQAAVPIGLAANVCNVNVAVLANLVSSAPTTCDSTVNQRTEQNFKTIQRIIARAG
jgi:hypothetical protein